MTSMNSQPQSQKLLSVSDGLQFAGKMFTQKFPFLIALTMVVFAVPNIISNLSPIPFTGLIMIPVNTFLMIGFYKVMLDIADGKNPGFLDLFSQGHLFFRYLFASLLCTIAIVLGFICFIVPGILLCIHLAFYPFLMVDRDFGMVESMKQSSQLSAGIRMQLFKYGALTFLLTMLLALGANIVTAIPMFIVNMALHMPLQDALALSNSFGMALTLSFSFMLLVYAYKNLKERALSMAGS